MMLVQKKRDDAVQWSSGYDFCLTLVKNTEGLQFDPGLDHFFFHFKMRKNLKANNTSITLDI